MNFLRGLVRWLILAVFVLACLTGLLFVPAVQNEVTQFLLGRSHHRVTITVDDVSYGLNSAHLEGVHVSGRDFDLTAPVVDLNLSMADFLLRRRAAIRNLVAKDWKAKGLEAALSVTGASLPWAVSVDQADLEGQVMIAPGNGKGIIPLDVVIKGGGMTPTANGKFEFSASGVFLTESMTQVSAMIKGRMSLGLGENHPPTQVTGTLTTSGAGFDALSGLVVTGKVGADGIRWALMKDSREKLVLDGNLSRGRWSLAINSQDVAPFFGDSPPPPFTALGSGDFQWNEKDKAVDFDGALKGEANAWPYTARFTVQHRGHELTIHDLSGTVSGVGFTALQSVVVDESSHELTYSQPASDLARLALDHFALERMPPIALLGATFRATAGRATGEVVVTGKGDQTYALRSARPLEIEGVALSRGDAPWVADLAGRLALEGTVSPDKWEIKASDLKLTRSGKPFLGGMISGVRATSSGEPWYLQGKLTSPVELGGWGTMDTTLNFTGLASDSLKLDGDLQARGSPKREVTASFHLAYDQTGSAQLQMPFKVAFGDRVSDLTIDATRVVEQDGERRYLKITGSKAIRDQLEQLAGPFWASYASQRPFWGPGSGRVGLSIDRFEFPGGAWTPLDAIVVLSPTHAELEEARVGLDQDHTVAVEGGVDYDPGAAVPYSLKGSLELDKVESGPLFKGPKGDPVVEGKFKVKRTLTSQGRDLSELLAHPLQSIHATSATALVRALAVNVGDAVPQHKTTVGQAAGNTAANVASFIFATKRNPLEGGKNPVTPKAEAVLNFTDLMAELDFDRLTVDAAEQPDGSYLVGKIEGSTDEIKISGSGRLGGKATTALLDRPVSLDLTLSFRGDYAKLLERGGVLTAPKDKKTWVALPGTVHLGGTAGQVDPSKWHDLLAPYVR